MVKESLNQRFLKKGEETHGNFEVSWSQSSGIFFLIMQIGFNNEFTKKPKYKLYSCIKQTCQNCFLSLFSSQQHYHRKNFLQHADGYQIGSRNETYFKLIVMVTAKIKMLSSSLAGKRIDRFPCHADYWRLLVDA